MRNSKNNHTKNEKNNKPSLISYIIYWSIFKIIYYIRMLKSIYNLVMVSFKSMISQLSMYIQIKTPKDYTDYFNFKSKNINRLELPHHMAIILNQSEQLNLYYQDSNTSDLHQLYSYYNKLSEILLWSLMIGIPRITIFDSHSILKKQHFTLFKSIFEDKKEYIQRSDNITYHINWLNKDLTNTNKSIPNIDGGKIQNLDISIVTILDGKQELINITKKFINENRKHTIDNSNYKEINQDYINSNLSEHLGGKNFEPEVAMDFSDKYIFSGFLPWHIKLTEFIKVEHFNHFYLERYLQFINSYCLIQKRFGK